MFHFRAEDIRIFLMQKIAFLLHKNRENTLFPNQILHGGLDFFLRVGNALCKARNRIQGFQFFSKKGFQHIL